MWLQRFLKGNLYTYILLYEIYFIYVLIYCLHPFFYSFIIKMNKNCSVGTILKFDCHVGKQKKNLKIDVEELPLHELELLWIRTKIGEEFSEVVKDIYSNHRYCCFFFRLLKQLQVV